VPEFSPLEWGLALTAAFFFGMSKAGLAGMGLLGVLFMAGAIPGKAATGVVLPLLISADLFAAAAFRTHVQWDQLRRLAWPIGAGVVAGWWLLRVMPDAGYRPLIGWMVLAMLALQLVRQRFPRMDAALPHSPAFAWVTGVLTGIATMVANAAGPIASTYLIILAVPKRQFVHTMAWLFLFVNLFKVPFGVQLGIINVGSLALNVKLVPAVLVGLWSGRLLIDRISPLAFNNIVLVLSGISAVWMLVR
jgi:hypothetical protein